MLVIQEWGGKGTKEEMTNTSLHHVIRTAVEQPREEHTMRVLIAQSCPTLCNTMDWSPPGSHAHGILDSEYWNG